MSCLSCISFIWEQVCGKKERVDLPSEIKVDIHNRLPAETVFLCGQNTRVDLPFEIIEDILSRLPSESLFLCGRECKPLGALTTSPSFVNTHLIRAATPTTPVIVFQHHLQYFGYDRKVKDIKVHMMDELSQNVVTKSIKMDLVPMCKNRKCMPLIFGSYNGFLLFTRFRYDVVLCIWNPVTKEEVNVISPHQRYEVRGFFFHKATQEYRLLYISFDDEKCFQFYILSLKTKCTRSVKNFSYPPSGIRNPVFLNDVLHWIVCDRAYKNVHGTYPRCSNSILLFDSITEEFSSIPHPGRLCWGMNWLWRKHLAMNLMEMEGRLCLCDHSSYNEIIVWILEDYHTKVWVKMHVLTEPLKMFPQIRCHTDVMVKVAHIFKDIVLLTVKSEEMVLYNIKLGTFRRVGKGKVARVKSILQDGVLFQTQLALVCICWTWWTLGRSPPEPAGAPPPPHQTLVTGSFCQGCRARFGTLEVSSPSTHLKPRIQDFERRSDN